MENHFQVSGQGPYFLVIYNLAFLVALFILLYEGYQRKFPMLKWILLLTFAWFSFIAGSKLITLSLEEWRHLLTNFSLPAVASKNLLGGLTAGILALFAGKQLFRFKQDFADVFAFALPLAIGTQRVGCFLAGCCHGTPVSLPWAVQYRAETLPHFHQIKSGLLSSQDLLSLPVHPVQLYETIGCLLILIIIFRLKKKLKASGSLFLASLILVSLVHFFVAFFRDAQAHTTSWNPVGGLSLLQGLIIILAPLFSLMLVSKELKFKEVKNLSPHKDLSILTSTLVLFSYFLVLFYLRNWLTSSETISLTLVLLVGSFFLSFNYFRSLYSLPARLIPLTAVAFSLLLMAQTIPENENDSTLVRQFSTLRLGFGSGKYFNSHTLGYGESCDYVSYTNYFEQKYTLGGAGYSLTLENLGTGEELNFGLDAMLGKHYETPLVEYQMEREEVIWGLTPFVNFDFKWVGITGGLHFGNLAYTFENISREGNEMPQTGVKRVNAYPQFFLRIGPKRIAFVDFHLADHFPSAFPGYRYQIGIGSGFGTTKGGYLRTGITNFSINESYGFLGGTWPSVNGFYLSGNLPIKDKYVLEPMMVFNSNPWKESEPTTLITTSGFQFSLGFGYRFGHKTKMTASPKKL